MRTGGQSILGAAFAASVWHPERTNAPWEALNFGPLSDQSVVNSTARSPEKVGGRGDLLDIRPSAVGTCGSRSTKDVAMR